MSDFRFVKPVEVRFRDCDPMGHVNNAVYLTYLENARFAYWREVVGAGGLTDPTFILARLECDFRAPATMGDLLDVKIRVDSIGRSSFVFAYQILQRNDGRVVADARSVQVMYDYSQARSIPVPDAVRAAFERFEGNRS